MLRGEEADTITTLDVNIEVEMLALQGDVGLQQTRRCGPFNKLILKLCYLVVRDFRSTWLGCWV